MICLPVAVAVQYLIYQCEGEKMQIPIINGIYTDNTGNYRTFYPENMIPVPTSNGISAGYLRPGYGITEFGTGPGTGRGGINWNNVCYRVMGDYFVKVNQDGTTTTIGTVGGSGQVTLDYSFDYLGVNADNKLFLYDGTTLTQITDSDLGTVLDFVWLDGYFVCTDGEFIVVTELNNPFSVNPTKYGSSEIDPDPIVGVEEIRNELIAINRYSIEFFDNIGGTGFPFQRIEGAQIQRGAVGTHAYCIFAERLAFVGSGRNEPNAVWLAYNGSTQKLSTREIDKILKNYTETQLSEITMQNKYDENNNQILINLPDKTLVYDINASQSVSQPVWYVLHSGLGYGVISQYKGHNFVWCYDKWLCEDPTSNKHGYLVDDISSHYGTEVSWEFGTTIVYNDSKGAIFHELELVANTGNVALGDDPKIFTQYSVDGLNWSTPRGIKSGKQGVRNKKLVWLQQGNMRDRRIQKFYGTSNSHLSFARLDARMEPLYV